MPLRVLAEGSLFAEQYGEGPSQVLALHGWGRDHTDFAASLNGLPTLTVDLPGFGASPPPLFPIGANGYAQLLTTLWDEFERPPVVVGHSFGGRVAVCLSLLLPVRALVLTGVPLLQRHNRSKPNRRYRLARLARRLRLLSEPRLEEYRQRYGSADYRAAQGVMRQILVKAVNESYESEMARIPVPVRLLWGEDDNEVPVEVASRALEVMKRKGVDADLQVLPGVGHQVPLAAPTALTATVEDILNG